MAPNINSDKREGGIRIAIDVSLDLGSVSHCSDMS
jgi:hypothetical protein